MFERFFTSERVFRFLLATGALLLVAIPVGIACFALASGSARIPASCAGSSASPWSTSASSS